MNGQHPDSLRAVLDSVFAAPAYRWVERPDPLAAIRHAWAAFKHWLFLSQEAHPLGYRLLVYLLGALALSIVAHAAWSFFRTLRTADEASIGPGRANLSHDQDWYHREADRLAAGGRFAEAIQADFLALVLALDARKVLRFHPSKTPAEYASESGIAPAARGEFQELVSRLYRYAFARMPCGAAEFADWRARAAPERYAPAH